MTHEQLRKFKRFCRTNLLVNMWNTVATLGEGANLAEDACGSTNHYELMVWAERARELAQNITWVTETLEDMTPEELEKWRDRAP